jgi:hypothetical protein
VVAPLDVRDPMRSHSDPHWLPLLALSMALTGSSAACSEDDEIPGQERDTSTVDTGRDTGRDTLDDDGGDDSDAADSSLPDTEDDSDDGADAGDDGDLADSSLPDTGTGDTPADTVDASDTTDTRPDTSAPAWTPVDTVVATDAVLKSFSGRDRDPSSTVYLTEVQINPNNSEGRGTSTEWFEVINMGSSQVQLNGVEIADRGNDSFTIGAAGADPSGGEPACAELPPVGAFFEDARDSTIGTGEFFTFYQKVQTDAACESDPSCKPYQGLHYYVFDRCYMAIGNSGDEIYLYDSRGRVLDCIEYGGGDDVEGFSYQRIYADGAWSDQWCLTPEVESMRYNDNGVAAPGPAGDHGTPAQPPRCR